MGDEVVIVDDFSTDGTFEFLKTIDDPRIRLFRNECNKGVNSTFERAISLANNEIIFLADQDDIWLEGRVGLMVNKLLDAGVMVVSSNFELMDRDGQRMSANSYRKLRDNDSTRYFLNLIGIFFARRNYYGCAMAIRKDIVDIILPLPKFVESHDLWIAMASNLMGSNLHISSSTLVRRIHGENFSIVRRSALLKVRARIIFLMSIMILTLRVFLFKMRRSGKLGGGGKNLAGRDIISNAGQVSS